MEIIKQARNWIERVRRGSRSGVASVRPATLLAAATVLLASSVGVFGIQHQRAAAKRAQTAALIEDIRRDLSDEREGADVLWQRFVALQSDHANAADASTVRELESQLLQRRSAERAARSQAAFDALESAEHRAEPLIVLLACADSWLAQFGGCEKEDRVRALRAAYVRRIEEKAIEPARKLSLDSPLEFARRRVAYQQYLDAHPAGEFADEARSALDRIQGEADRRDFRLFRDHFTARPGDVAALTSLGQAYRSAHPNGRFAASVDEVLRWLEQVSATNDYHVTLKNGQIEKRLSRYLSRGPDLSVEVEVAGVRHGPSNIVSNSYAPEWDYKFPRAIRWRLGDPVRVRVTDHDYGYRVVLDLTSEAIDPLGLQLISSECWSGGNRLTFESDFRVPVLPAAE